MNAAGMAEPFEENDYTAFALCEPFVQSSMCNNEVVGQKSVLASCSIGPGSATATDACNTDTAGRRLQTDDDTLFVLVTFEQSFDAATGTNIITAAVEMTTQTGGSGMSSSELNEIASLVGQNLNDNSATFLETLNDNDSIQITSISGISAETGGSNLPVSI